MNNKAVWRLLSRENGCSLPVSPSACGAGHICHHTHSLFTPSSQEEIYLPARRPFRAKQDEEKSLHNSKAAKAAQCKQACHH